MHIQEFIVSKPAKPAKFRLSNRKPPVAFETLVADYAFLRLLRHFKRAKSFRIVVVLPPAADVVIWSEAAGGPMSLMFPVDKFHRADWDVDVLKRKPIGPMSCQYPKHLVVVAHADADLVTPEIEAGADAVVSIGEVSADIVKRVAKLRLGMNLDDETAHAVAELPMKTREYLMRPGSDVAKAIRRMPKTAVVVEAPAPVVQKTENPRLEDLYGYGEAKDWGLQLARDLTDFREGVIVWDDVDRGLLLSGPPGTGKTTYAKALAETCGVHFERASYGVWFSKGQGGQGDLIKAMHKSFEAAMKHAPSILLIDEIDSFGDRDAQPDWHAEWSRQVVNALLECLDGAGSREGVVVIGACNNPTIVDPAIKRSGRLDRQIVIPLPDAAARPAILRWHLQADIQVGDIVRRTEGMSGADLERIARDARRAARIARRPVQTSDLVAALPVRIPYSIPMLRSTAIHEAGHAIVGVILNVGKLRFVEIESDFDPNVRAQSAGQAAWEYHQRFMKGRADYEGMIAMTLAAMEAERALLGCHFDGVNSDLRQASVWAGAMVSAYGMDGRLVSVNEPLPEELVTALRRDARLQEAVDRILQTQRDRARALVEDHVGLIEALAERLLRERRVDGEEVVDMVRRAMDAPVQLSLVV